MEYILNNSESLTDGMVSVVGTARSTAVLSVYAEVLEKIDPNEVKEDGAE